MLTDAEQRSTLPVWLAGDPSAFAALMWSDSRNSLVHKAETTLYRSLRHCSALPATHGRAQHRKEHSEQQNGFAVTFGTGILEETSVLNFPIQIPFLSWFTQFLF
jgi:hypothetical protein